MFIDTHAHLTDTAFEGQAQYVIERARQSKVQKIITSGTDIKTSRQALEFALHYDDIYCSIGFYPEYIKDFNEEAEKELFVLGKNSKVVAIGEIGLQYTPDMPEKKLQQEAFVRQMSLACQLDKPIVIHCREGYGDLIELLKANKKLFSGGTLHCFGGSYEIAKEAIDLGYYISVGGVSTFKNASRLKEVISKLPLERIVLETDCPYLAPHPFRGQLNMPSFIPTIAENLAKLKEVSVGEVEEVTTQNARRLFGI